MTKNRAIAELLFAGALWGFGFVATVWGLKAFTPAEVLILRFLITAVAGEAIWRLWLRRRSPFPETGAKKDFLLALPAGFLLAGLLLPQTIGLLYTTAAKSGFLTTLYIVLVPLFGHLLFRHPLRLAAYGHGALALVGAFLLMEVDFGDVNKGDLWTLLCAVIATFHILYIGHVSPRITQPFRFNTFQSFFCLLGVLPLLAMQGRATLWTDDTLAWTGVLFLALASSLIGFTIQIRTQKILSPTTASMLFLLESPYALLFGVMFLRETFSLQQAAGAALILTASALSVRSDPSANSK